MSFRQAEFPPHLTLPLFLSFCFNRQPDNPQGQRPGGVGGPRQAAAV